MKSLMDGIVSALKRKNQEKSQFNGIYRVFGSHSGELDDYCNAEDYYSR